MLTSYYFGKTIETLRLAIKNNAILLQASEASLEEYKNSYFEGYTQKTAIFKTANMNKKIFFSIIGGR